MNRVMMTLCMLGAAGCGDSLVSGEDLDWLFGLRAVPDNPAWEMRWLSPDGGLVVACDLEPAIVVEEDEIQFGEIVVDAPPDTPPAAFVEDHGFDWALGLPVLVDADRYDPTLGGPTESLGRERGVWGLPFGRGIVHIYGELPERSESLFVEDGPQEEGAYWVEVLSDFVVVAQDVRGALVPVEEYTDEEIWVFGGELDEDWTVFEVWSGVALGGVVSGDCGE